MCTYEVAYGNPQFVATTNAGIVYITSVENMRVRPRSVYVDVFRQCGSRIKRYAQYGHNIGGVAVDGLGNIFVRIDPGGLEEFKKGDSTPTPLAHIGGVAGLIVDKNGTLITVNDSSCIYVSSPPYASLRKLYCDPAAVTTGLSLNEGETVLYAAGWSESGAVAGVVNLRGDAATGVAVLPDATFSSN